MLAVSCVGPGKTMFPILCSAKTYSVSRVAILVTEWVAGGQNVHVRFTTSSRPLETGLKHHGRNFGKKSANNYILPLYIYIYIPVHTPFTHISNLLEVICGRLAKLSLHNISMYIIS